MKLLIYCYEYPPIGGGAGNALSHLAREWVRTGGEVTVVTSRFGDLPRDARENGVRVIRLWVARGSVSRGRVWEMALYLLQSYLTAHRIFKESRPDLAVAFMSLPSGAAPARLSRRFGLPLVTELRGGDVPGFLPELLGLFHVWTRGWIKSIWSRSKLVIANSRGLADLAKLTSPEIDFKIVPNGVDTSVFSPSSGPSSEAAGCRFLFVGRLVDAQKQIGRLVRAVASHPNWELTVVGAGPDEASLRRSAAFAGAESRVRFAGWLGREDLVTELRRSDVYVSASVGEGMSNSALEALSCGLPLVLSRIPGHEELVEEGKNGFLFDPASQAELEERMARVAGDANLRRRLGEASRSKAVGEFDWAPLAARHLELYRRALSA